MIRMTFFLILGIGAAMLLADNPENGDNPRNRQDDRTAALEPLQASDTASPSTETTDLANGQLTMASHTVTPPATISSDTQPLANSDPATTMVPFMTPVVVKDGVIVVPEVPTAPAPAILTNAATQEPTRNIDVRYVTAKRVNVRQGPSTGFEVLDQVVLGDAVEVLSTDTSGWVKIRIEGDGVEGYMSGRYLQTDVPYN